MKTRKLWMPFCQTSFKQLNNRLELIHFAFRRITVCWTARGAVALWLVRSSPDRAVRVRALAWDIALCSRARNLTLAVPLSTQVYKWVPANLMLGVTLRWTGLPHPGGSTNTPSRFMLRKAGYAPTWWATWLAYRLNLLSVGRIKSGDGEKCPLSIFN